MDISTVFASDLPVLKIYIKDIFLVKWLIFFLTKKCYLLILQVISSLVEKNNRNTKLYSRETKSSVEACVMLCVCPVYVGAHGGQNSC